MINAKLFRSFYQLDLNKINLIRNSGQYQRSFKLSNSTNYNELRDMMINLAKKENLANNDFEELRSNLILNQRHITEINVDYFIVSTYNEVDHLNLVEKYVDYIKNKNLEVNTSTLGRLMKLYNLAYHAGILTVNNQNRILNIYEEISNKYKNFDARTCENLIFGLICTKEWKKSLELLETMKLSAQPTLQVYNCIISKAFENDEDHELGWKLLIEMIRDYKKIPNCEIFLSFLKWIQIQNDNIKQIENLNRIFNFIGEYDIVISKLVVNELKKTLNLMKLKHAETEINFKGKCNNCNLFLERILITNNDFQRMRSAFLDRVIVRKDVFIKSNPKELEKFLSFIDKNAPFHCVVDGLNVAYSKGGKQSPDLVCSVIKYFKDINMSVLLIGRKHMNKWPNVNLSYIKKNCKMFLTDDLSQDDPFLLYAALISGPSTNIFSRDLMRSHSFLLGDELKIIFKRWLQEHQYSLVTVKQNGKIIIKEPSKFNINAHKIETNWHLPYKDIYKSNPKDNYEVPNNWLCIKVPKTNNDTKILEN